MGTAQGIVACGLFASALCASSPGRADSRTPKRVELAWRSPEGCPSRSAVLARIDEYLGGRDLNVSAAQADATIARADDGHYSLLLTLDAASGHAQRELSANTCAELAQAAALLIAIAVDPTLASTPEAEAPPPAEPAPEPPPPEPSEKPPAPKPALPSAGSRDRLAPATDRERAMWDFALLAILDLSSMPGASFGLLGEGDAKVSLFRFGLAAEVFLPAEGNASQIPTASVSVTAFMARGTVCPVWRVRAFELGPCAFGEIGRTTGEAHGIRMPLSGSALWLALGALAQARFQLGASFNLLAEAGAAFPGTRQRFVVSTDSGAVAVHRAAAISPRFGLGISYDFE